jgi:putative tryptophan/tyrosine transport system substrate-binding protein
MRLATDAHPFGPHPLFGIHRSHLVTLVDAARTWSRSGMNPARCVVRCFQCLRDPLGTDEVIDMRRRDFIAGLLVASTVRHARAQQPAKVHRIAVINTASPVTEITETGSLRYFRAFFQELRRLGYVEGRNLIVERYSGLGQTEHYAELARVVVHSQPDLILASTNIWVQLLKPLTATIPIVGTMGDPIGFGLVASLAHPGGNITGISVDAGPEIQTKRLELLREAFPPVSRVGYLGRPLPGSPYFKLLQEAAQSMGISLVGPRREGNFQETEYRRVFEAIVQEHADALYVGNDSEHIVNRRLIVELAEKNRLPTIYPLREYVGAGGLMSYGVDLVDLFTRVAGYIDQILKGISPGDIPVYQAAKFELVVNVQAANAIGLTIPPALVLRADEVIE